MPRHNFVTFYNDWSNSHLFPTFAIISVISVGLAISALVICLIYFWESLNHVSTGNSYIHRSIPINHQDYFGKFHHLLRQLLIVNRVIWKWKRHIITNDRISACFHYNSTNCTHYTWGVLISVNTFSLGSHANSWGYHLIDTMLFWELKISFKKDCFCHTLFSIAK